MKKWKGVLKADPTEWLLGTDNPSVRYLTLTGILGRKPSNPEVRSAKEGIMKTGMVPKILGRLKDGSWNDKGRFYTDKYTGTVWQLIILAEHEANGEDSRIRRACEYLIGHSQDREGYGFSQGERAGGLGGRHAEVIPCLTGNMVWSLLKLGYADDERIDKGIDWITRYQRFDDGDGDPPDEWPYDRYEMCWGRHSCHMGVVKSLKALSAIPRKRRNRMVDATIEKACDYILAHHVYKESHKLTRTSKPGWRKLQFPLMYQTDVLEVTGLLVDLGVRDARMQDAIDLIASKQNADGTWTLECTFNGRFQANIERKDRPSKWVTCRSMKVLKGYYGD